MIADEANASVALNATTLPIVPNYMSNPPFPYAAASNDHFQLNQRGAVLASNAAGEWINQLFCNWLSG